MQQKLFQLWILPPAVDMLETHIYLFLTIWQKAANSEQQTTITTRDTIVFRHVNNVWRCCTIVGDGVLTRSSHQMPLFNWFLKEDGQVLFREISLWYCSNLSNKVKHCLHVCNTRHYCCLRSRPIYPNVVSQSVSNTCSKMRKNGSTN